VVDSESPFALASLAAAIDALERVRGVQRCAGVLPYDQPEVTGNRLSFRNGYQKGCEKGWRDWTATGEWSAYVIELTERGAHDVLFQRLPEHSSERRESLRASFSRLEDATKFVIVNVVESTRTHGGLDSLFVLFRGRGLDDRVVKLAPEEVAITTVVARISPEKDDLVRSHLQGFALKEDPSTSAIGFPSVAPYVNVLPLTYREVESASTAGMPPSVLDCVRDGLRRAKGILDDN
jgi:hypothetical protein